MENNLLISFNPETKLLVIGKKDFQKNQTKLVNVFEDNEAVDIIKTILGTDKVLKPITFCINWDFSRGRDKTIMVAGQKNPGDPELKVLNVLGTNNTGGDVFDLIKKLLGKNNL